MTTRTGPAGGSGVVNSVAPWSAAAHHSPDAASLGAPYATGSAAGNANLSSATAGTAAGSGLAPGFVGRGGMFRSDVPASTTQAVRALADRFVDGLCFGGAFTIDADFQAVTPQDAHAKDAAVSQQGRRVDDLFRVRAASPDLLAMVLDDLFRIDAVTVASVTGATNPDAAAGSGAAVPPPNVIDAMTDVTARIFKKEMKQRIHDWEGAFRTLHGRETMPADKNRLRHIYELYKVVKNRVQRPSTSGPGGSGGDGGRAGGSAVGAAAPAATNATTATTTGGATSGTPATTTTTSSGGGGGGATTTLPHIVPNAAGDRRDGAAAPRSASAPGQRTTGASSSGGTGTAASGGASRPAARTQTPAPTGSGSANGAAAGPGVSHDALLAEKKQLKRRLHAFETEFARNNGRTPGREDRFPLLAEYQRYGELKTQLAAYGGGD